MGNCISRIIKDRLLDLEEFMKNATSSEKVRVRPGLDSLTGRTYTRIHSIKGLSKKRSVCPITGRDVVEKLFLKTGGQSQH